MMMMFGFDKLTTGGFDLSTPLKAGKVITGTLLCIFRGGRPSALIEKALRNIKNERIAEKRDVILTTTSKVSVGKIQILLPVVVCNTVLTGADMIAYIITYRMMDFWLQLRTDAFFTK